MSSAISQNNRPRTGSGKRGSKPQPKDDPKMEHLGIGIDTGRYGHHVTFLRDDKQHAGNPMTVMEKAADYAKLQLRLEQLHERFPNAHMHLRIDAAGQYADNIEAFVRGLVHLPMTVSVGQPKTNKDYHSVCSPKSKTDKSTARDLDECIHRIGQFGHQCHG